MKNFWLNRKVSPGRKVKYTGPDFQLKGKIGTIYRLVDKNWIDVNFGHGYGTKTIEKEFIEAA